MLQSFRKFFISFSSLSDYDIIFVKAFNASAYELSGAVNGSNADIEITRGDVLKFMLDATGHPFWIKMLNGTGTELDRNLTDNAVSSGIHGVGQGSTFGPLIWDTKEIIAGTYYYQCEYHPQMVGKIIVKNDIMINVKVVPNSPSVPNVYELSGAVSGKNAYIEIFKGSVVKFELDIVGPHPFWIKTVKGHGQNDPVSSGISGVGQGKRSGLLIWDTTGISEGAYYYECQWHPGMGGLIRVVPAVRGRKFSTFRFKY